MLQPSFAAGEISPDVASRVDLDKYASALLQARNAFIRPYGSAYRRPGTLHIADLASGKIKLQEFAVDADKSYLLEFGNNYLNVWYDGVKKATLSTPFAGTELHKLRFAQSADVMFIASGSHPVQELTRYSDTSWTLTEYIPYPGYFDATTMVDGVTITPSAVSGTVTLTASAAAFTSGQVGNWVQLNQNIAAATVTRTTSGTSGSLEAGPAGWKIISHGTWTGTFSVEYSSDNANWKTLRSYSSKDDFNVTESGTFDEKTYIRINASIDSGTFSADLTRLPYTSSGTARITAYTDSTHVTAKTDERFANTSASNDWAFGSWCSAYGYPSCVTFFQDRLCFAANNRQPFMVWMSRTGDYYNFGVEKADGEVLDDSAIAVSFISRRDFRILHLMAQADLIVLTEGNEWIISGRTTVTPKEIAPQVQTSRGCTDVIPEMIGGQMIYVQRHGKTVRDLQYNYTIDSYDGMDLSILAKHITLDTHIVDAAYKQEPDYMMFFVLADGTIACLTYINEQKVYAWSRMITNGTFVAVETVDTPDEEDVYFVVNRDGTNYLERLADYAHSDVPNDYVMLDCAKKGTNTPKSDTITAAWLADQEVDVLADGEHIMGLTADENGEVTLPVACKNYVIGYRYKTLFETPNIEMQLNDGSMQGRKKKIAEVILRLERSLAGRVGIDERQMDVIKFDELSDQTVKLYSGEKMVTVPNITAGGYNDKGRVTISTSYPYPFSISSLVRAVRPGG